MSEPGSGPRIRFDAMPPDISEIWVPILSPKPGCAVRGVVISEYLAGVWTHYVEGRTEPHLEGPAGCPGCELKRAKRWKGYYAIEQAQSGRIGLVEITAWALANCQPLNEQPYRTVRGWLIDVSRPAGKANGRVSCLIQPPPYRRSPEPIPDPIDVPAALVRIWSGRRDGPTHVIRCGQPIEEPPF